MRPYIYGGQVTHYFISENGELYNSKTKKYQKGHINSAGYKIYYFNFNGVKKNLYAHRMVAETYIPNNNPNKDCINHIDGNKLNNNVNNLEWVTRAENNRHAATTKLNDKTKTVYCFDKNKNLVATYESLNSAAKLTGFAINSIADCAISEKKVLTCGFFWSYINDNTFEIIKPNKRHTKPVGRYDLNENLLEEYSSITEASQLTHFPRVRISDCARGKIKTYGGFIWKFL